MAPNWYHLIFEVIDLRSFSNLWFWIALAALWSSASHRVLGVPFDMIVRARREGGAVQADLETMVRINVDRVLHIAQTSGLWLAGFGCFMLTSLILLGFVYEMEFAQAVFLLLSPMVIVGLLTLRTARKIRAGGETGADLDRRLMRHRMSVQAVGMAAILVTSMYGMWVNMQLGALG
ncbi:MAG: component of SufBCD complex [Paracoccaceae bacterium]